MDPLIESQLEGHTDSELVAAAKATVAKLNDQLQALHHRGLTAQVRSTQTYEKSYHNPDGSVGYTMDPVALWQVYITIFRSL